MATWRPLSQSLRIRFRFAALAVWSVLIMISVLASGSSQLAAGPQMSMPNQPTVPNESVNGPGGQLITLPGAPGTPSGANDPDTFAEPETSLIADDEPLFPGAVVATWNELSSNLFATAFDSGGFPFANLTPNGSANVGAGNQTTADDYSAEFDLSWSLDGLGSAFGGPASGTGPSAGVGSSLGEMNGANGPGQESQDTPPGLSTSAMPSSESDQPMALMSSSVDETAPVAVPEPASWALVALGALMVVVFGRRLLVRP